MVTLVRIRGKKRARDGTPPVYVKTPGVKKDFSGKETEHLRPRFGYVTTLIILISRERERDFSKVGERYIFTRYMYTVGRRDRYRKIDRGIYPLFMLRKHVKVQ